jgi:hypothetical protein
LRPGEREDDAVNTATRTVAAITRLLVTALAAAIAGAGAAHAYPGDPQPGCETTSLGTLICDGPIRPDGSWQRCAYKPGLGGRYPQPPMTVCRVVTAETCRGPLDFDVPDHHIDQ